MDDGEKAKPFVLTYFWLATRGACGSQIRKFRRLYGESVELTRENLLAADHMFDKSWLIFQLAPEAYGEYMEAVDAAEAEFYMNVSDRDDPICRKALASSKAELRRVIAEAACKALGL